MSITSIKRDQAYQPFIVRIVSSNTLAAVGTAGYLTAQLSNIEAINEGPFEWLPNDMVLVSASDGLGFFSVSADFASLVGFVFTTAVTGATVVGDFPQFDSVSGNLIDNGKVPSDNTKTVVVMAGSAVVSGRMAKFVDTAGTIDDTAGTAVNLGSIQAGASGTAGSLTSFPATAASGTLSLVAANSAGNFAGIITNASLGQAVTWTLADPAGAASNILQAAGALTSGNVLKASGTAGLVADAGFAVHAGTTAAYAGGGTSNAFVTTNMTASSIVAAVILTSTNAVSIAKAVPGVNTLTVTFSADPGANTTVNWISVTPAVA